MKSAPGEVDENDCQFNRWLRQGTDLGVALSSAAMQEISQDAPNRFAVSRSSAVGKMKQIISGVLFKPLLRLKNRSKRIARRELELSLPSLVEASNNLLRSEFESLRAAQVQFLDRIDAAIQTHLEISRSELGLLNRIEQYACAAARRQAVTCSMGDVLVRTEVGYLLCDAGDTSLLATLMDTGDLEPGTRKLIQAILEPGDVFIDAGANLGFHTIAAARAMAGRGKIVAIEPFGPTKLRLERSIWLNGFSNLVEVHEAAAADVRGSRTLYLGRTSGHHSLFPLNSHAASDMVNVSSVTLDDMIADDEKVRLIKIDAEGAELDILSGAKSVLKHNPDILLVVEFGEEHLRRVGSSVGEWFAAFADFGFHPFAIDEYSGELVSLAPDELNDLKCVNILFSRDRFFISDLAAKK